MGVYFLLDENMEPQVRARLEAYGHTVEHIRDVPELGLGATDVEIAAYSKQNEHVILTYDDDFHTVHDESEYHCVIFFEDDARSANEVADIAHRMADAYPESAFTGVQYGNPDWL